LTSIEPLDPEIKNLINNQLDFILNFAEFISGERPSSNYTRIIAELRLFQKKLLERDSTSTTYAETIRYQNRILSIFINWKPAISSPLLSLVNFYVDANKITTKPVTLMHTNPFRIVMKNRDRFLRGHQVMDDVTEK
jgi:hypothetical protein